MCPVICFTLDIAQEQHEVAVLGKGVYFLAQVVVGTFDCSSFLVSEVPSSGGSLIFPGEASKVWLEFTSSDLL